MTEETVAALNDPALGLQRLAIADACLTPKPSAGIPFYAFNEPGTWGYCRWCRFVVTLDEDGLIHPHTRLLGSSSTAVCSGGRKQPQTYYRNEVTDETAPVAPEAD
jgi:hypothetical protein